MRREEEKADGRGKKTKIGEEKQTKIGKEETKDGKRKTIKWERKKKQRK